MFWLLKFLIIYLLLYTLSCADECVFDQKSSNRLDARFVFSSNCCGKGSVHFYLVAKYIIADKWTSKHAKLVFNVYN